MLSIPKSKENIFFHTVSAEHLIELLKTGKRLEGTGIMYRTLRPFKEINGTEIIRDSEKQIAGFRINPLFLEKIFRPENIFAPK